MTGMQAIWSLFWKNQVQSAAFRSFTDERILSCRQNCANKVRPQRVSARRQQELPCFIAFQELERHAIDDVKFEGNVEDINELFAKSGIPIVTNRDPIREHE